MKHRFLAIALGLGGALTAHAQSIELISRAFDTTSASANGSSLGGAYSPDGKFILFSSTAPDLVNLPNQDQFNLYLLNTTGNSIQLISAGPNGEHNSRAR